MKIEGSTKTGIVFTYTKIKYFIIGRQAILFSFKSYRVASTRSSITVKEKRYVGHKTDIC